MTIITLMTDFGNKDGNVGVMKGVIWGIFPAAQIVDLSHMVGPQNIQEGAYILERATPYFPERTVHVIVIDPGVGTVRRPIAAWIGGQYFICPDNGLITLILDSAKNRDQPIELIELDRKKYWLPVVSHVFHGRDIFSPCAAHLAKGIPLLELGTRIEDVVRLKIPRPERSTNGWVGEIIYIDHFGNIISNIRVENLGSTASDNIVVQLNGVDIKGLVKTFGERPPGELVGLINSTGALIVSEVNGNAAKRLDVRVGDILRVISK